LVGEFYDLSRGLIESGSWGDGVVPCWVCGNWIIFRGLLAKISFFVVQDGWRVFDFGKKNGAINGEKIAEVGIGVSGTASAFADGYFFREDVGFIFISQE
jgi:hypothetical protein